MRDEVVDGIEIALADSLGHHEGGARFRLSQAFARFDPRATWLDQLQPAFGEQDAGRRVVVIGSGATAVTLVPALAERAAHVTMLQRSPTYVVSRPAEDAVANFLRRVLPKT